MNELRQLTAELQLSSVKFSGKIEHSQLPAYYQASDFYITASLSENYLHLNPGSAGQWTFRRTSVRSSPMNIEYQQGLTGFTFETEEQLRHILGQLAAQPVEDKFKLRQAVRQHTRLHSSDEAIRHMLDLYEMVIMERSPHEQRSADIEVKLKQ
ncbi:MAG: hypothetical protein ACLR23_27190 [Clostridia bacterium]